MTVLMPDTSFPKQLIQHVHQRLGYGYDYYAYHAHGTSDGELMAYAVAQTPPRLILTRDHLFHCQPGVAERLSECPGILLLQPRFRNWEPWKELLGNILPEYVPLLPGRVLELTLTDVHWLV